jgi:radical SAM superfamily enzyme YgiQ (UPF0313 family)
LPELKGRRLKITLINPIFPNSFWSFQGLEGFVKNYRHAPLGLATVAALTPPEIDIEILDENVETVNVDQVDADVVGFTAFNVQIKRAVELAREFKKRGKTIIIGGPYVSLIPEPFTELFDVVFVGEAENIWPKFCQDLIENKFQKKYVELDKIDITKSPIPRYELLKTDHYNAFYLQTSRGCPFTCEFCDIIITNGRIPRTKTIDQVMAEVDLVSRLGGNSITYSDANFIGNPSYAKEVLTRLVDYGKKNNYPIRFSAEMTINVADREDLLSLMEEANFAAIFFGIESPRASSLNETKKTVNLRSPLIESIRKIQRHNIFPWAGMIVGFDSDDYKIFEDQFNFLMEAGIPFTTSGILVAIPTTPLFDRLKREGRLTMSDEQFRVASEEWRGHGCDNLNFTPKQMTQEELLTGYKWMLRQIYSYENFSKRLETCMQNFRTTEVAARRDQESFARDEKNGIGTLLKILKHYLLTWDNTRRNFFVKTLFRVLKGRWTKWNFSMAMSYLVLQKHFHEYVTETQGNPEDADFLSPYYDWKPALKPTKSETAAEPMAVVA